ncbi:MAG: class I tRNA ligase family protein [Nanoarchaeota archaeon]
MPKHLPEGQTEQDIVAEEDVMDTWMTSSMTPYIILNKGEDDDWTDSLFPCDLRPQAHEIIRTWAFYTIAKAHFHDDSIPWSTVMISGHGQDAHGGKMSKSLGNVVNAHEVIQKYSADALRYWAAISKLGDDVPFQEKDLLTGQKLINKLWNASRFLSIHLEGYDGSRPEKLEPLEEWLLSELNEVIKQADEHYKNYEVYRARALLDNFFWNVFCDNFLEIVKGRLYSDEETNKLSAQYALYQTLLAVCKMYAPIMPFITESVYQYFLKGIDEDAVSIHATDWPALLDVDAELDPGRVAVQIVSNVRRHKSQEHVSLKTPVEELVIAPATLQEKLQGLLPDVERALFAEKIIFADEAEEKVSDDLSLSVSLGEPPKKTG